MALSAHPFWTETEEGRRRFIDAMLHQSIRHSMFALIADCPGPTCPICEKPSKMVDDCHASRTTGHCQTCDLRITVNMDKAVFYIGGIHA